MSSTLSAVHTANPVTTIGAADLVYVDVGPGTDGGMTGSDLAAWVASKATNASNLSSGTLPDARLANVITAGGPVGDATHVPAITFDAHGRLTAVSSVAISLPPAGRQLLTANVTYHVTTGGNDSTGDGSSGTPWATQAKAWSYICSKIDTGGFDVTVQLGNGTAYTGVQSGTGPVGGGRVIFQGNTSDATQVKIVDAAGPFAFTGLLSPQVVLKWMTLNGGAGAQYAVYVGATGIVVIDPSVIIDANTFSDGIFVTAVQGAQINLAGSGQNTINGSGTTFALYFASGGQITIGNGAVASGSPTFSAGVAYSRNGGFINTTGASWSGTFNGPRYSVEDASIIQTYGGGANYFPGSSAGSGAGVYA